MKKRSLSQGEKEGRNTRSSIYESLLETKGAKSIVIPPDKKRALKFARPIIWLGPRPLELLSVILLSAGINIITGLFDVPSPIPRALTAILFTLSGAFFFLFSAIVARCFEDAGALQRNKLDNDQPITAISTLAAGMFARGQFVVRFLTLLIAVLLFVGGVGSLVYELRNRPGQPVPVSGDPNSSIPSSKDPQAEETRR